MVFIQAIKRRGILRQIVAGAIANAQTLNEALTAFQGNIYSPNFAKGRLLVSTSGNGQAASFEIAMNGKEFTQDNMFAASEEFFEILWFALNQNTALTDDGIAASSNAIFAAMLVDDRLQTVTRRGVDVTLLGWPQVGLVGGQA